MLGLSTLVIFMKIWFICVRERKGVHTHAALQHKRWEHTYVERRHDGGDGGGEDTYAGGHGRWDLVAIDERRPTREGERHN